LRPAEAPVMVGVVRAERAAVAARGRRGGARLRCGRRGLAGGRLARRLVRLLGDGGGRGGGGGGAGEGGGGSLSPVEGGGGYVAEGPQRSYGGSDPASQPLVPDSVSTGRAESSQRP